MTHPTARTLPWLVRARRPKAKIDPQEYVESISSGMRMSTHLCVYLPFKLFDCQLTLDVILLTLVLK